MSLTAATSAWACVAALSAYLLAVHLRFTQKHAELAPLLLLCGGALGVLLPLLQGAAPWQANGPSQSALLALLLATAGAMSVRIRQLVWGIPRRLAIDPGPSNGELHALIESLSRRFQLATADAERLRAARHEQLAGQVQALAARLEQHAQAGAERHHALLAASASLAQALRSFAAEQQAQNRDSLMAALGGVIEDFNQRINGQFDTNLAALQAALAGNSALLEKHRLQQAEMMHHARRGADQMTRTTTEFRELVEQSTALAGLCATVQQALDLLGPRQDALGSDLDALGAELARANASLGGLHSQFDAALDEFVQRSKRVVEGVGQRVGQNASELQQALQRSAEQTRGQHAELAGKHQQQIAAMNKELSEALAKLLATLNKQLTGMSSKLSTDLAPMAQQIRRVADLSKAIK